MNDPRFVAVVAERIRPSPGIWIKGIALEPEEKALVIFAPNQVRLYPLTDERRGTGKPVKFRVGYDSVLQSSDHVIHQEGGIVVYVTVASRQERVQWAIDRLRPTSLLDHLDVITELQHLICHRVVTERLDFDVRGLTMFHEYLFQALACLPEYRLEWARKAIEVGKQIAFAKGESK